MLQEPKFIEVLGAYKEFIDIGKEMKVKAWDKFYQEEEDAKKAAEEARLAEEKAKAEAEAKLKAEEEAKAIAEAEAAERKTEIADEDIKIN